MRRGKKTELQLPERLTFEPLKGEAFLKVKTAARLAGIPPVVLEMAQALLKDTNHGARFKLATPELQRKATDIEVVFRAGLKRVAKALGHMVAVRSHRDGDAFVFWFDTSGPGLHSKKPK